MGMNEKAYTIGWILTGYIRIGIVIKKINYLGCNYF